MSNFHVALKKVVDDSYDVQIGCGLIDDMIQDIKEGLVGNKKKFAVITDSNVDEVYGRPVLEKILAAGYQGDLFVFAAGEKSKVRKETTAKFFFDMAKLTFAALVLGVAASLLNREIEDEIPSMANYLFAMGFIGTVAFAMIGYRILK